MAFTASTEILEDVIILGRAAPEELSDGRRTICTGAWSEHRGFLRLYPITEPRLFSRWDKVDVEVKRNPQDTRHESWKLAGRDQQACVTHKGEFPRENRATLLHNLTDRCVLDINEEGRSLGLIRPRTTPSIQFQPWGDDEDTVQSRLFEETDEWRPETRDEFEHEIRVEFQCSDCQTKQGFHNKTLLEWGAYLAKMKNDIDDPQELEKFYDLGDENYRHWIFVGNQANHRTSFIAINLIWLKDDVVIHDSPFDDTNYRKVADDFESQRS